MATSYSGPAPVTVRTLEDCPDYDGTPSSGCRACKKGRSNDCRYPYRKGKTSRDRRNIRHRLKNIKDLL